MYFPSQESPSVSEAVSWPLQPPPLFPLDGSYVSHFLGALCWGAPRLRVLWGDFGATELALWGSWGRSEGAGKTLCTQRPPLDLYILLVTSVEHQGATDRPRAFASLPGNSLMETAS